MAGAAPLSHAPPCPRADAWVCGHCFRFLGSVEAQVARQVTAARDAALAHREGDGSDAASEGSDGSSSQDKEERVRLQAALALEESQVEALAKGQLCLPHTDAVPLPTPVSRSAAAVFSYSLAVRGLWR